MFVEPTIQDFKDFFTRDFPFGTDIETEVIDSDIQKAFKKTKTNINTRCISDQDEYDLQFFNLSAHYLTMNLRASSQGINGSAQWPVNSRSVGGVSESYTIPEWITKSPIYSHLTQTPYGTEYLMGLLPCLVGNLMVVKGRTTL